MAHIPIGAERKCTVINCNACTINGSQHKDNMELIEAVLFSDEPPKILKEGVVTCKVTGQPRTPGAACRVTDEEYQKWLNQTKRKK